MSYTNLFKLLEGTPLDSQSKGGNTAKFNNQLIIMNYNASHLIITPLS